MAQFTPTEQAAIVRIGQYNGNPYNASSNPFGMANGGHQFNFIPSLNDGGVTMSQASLRFANEAVQAANSLSSDYVATSTTSVEISSGQITLTIETGKAFQPGNAIRVSVTASPSTNYMTGIVESYNSGTGELVFDSEVPAGSGTHAAWSIGINTVRDQTGGGVQLDYSANTSIPSPFVVALNPSAAGLVAALDSADGGDIKRLVNVSQFDAVVRLTGAGFIIIQPNDTAFVMRVDGNWYAASFDNQSVPDSIFSPGSPTVFNSGATSETAVASLTDSTVVICYQDTAASNRGNAIVGQISGFSISFGAEVSFNTTATRWISVDRLSDSSFVVSYQNDGSSDRGTAIVGTVSGNVISFGSAAIFNNAQTLHTTVAALSETKFVVCYVDQANSGRGTSIIGDVAGTVITYGSEHLFNNAATARPSVVRLTSTSFGVSYSDASANTGNAVVGAVAGNVITHGSEVTFTSQDIFQTRATSIDDSTIVVCFRESTSPRPIKVIAGLESNGVFSFGQEQTVEGVLDTNEEFDISRIGPGRFAVSYQFNDTPDLDFGTLIFAQVSSNNITLGEPVTFNEDRTSFNSIAAVDENKFITTYRDFGNSNFGTALVGELIV